MAVCSRAPLCPGQCRADGARQKQIALGLRFVELLFEFHERPLKRFDPAISGRPPVRW